LILSNLVYFDNIGGEVARAKIGDERREQILSAFERCVIRVGLAKTTLQNVANEAGLPRSLIRYFVGNKDDMIGLIIDRMIERAEHDLTLGLQENRDPTFTELLDFVSNGAFSNKVTNSLIGELWYLSEKDADIKSRLGGLYRHLLKLLVDQMTKEKIGENKTVRQAFAQSVMSLAYGEESFREIGLRTSKSHRALMIKAMLSALG
jgi:AcrR family transcriptional regulator